MIEEHLTNWLEGIELGLEQKVIAGLALALARSFDENPHTSTAAELRKTILELSRQLSAQAIDFDPIEELLTRECFSARRSTRNRSARTFLLTGISSLS
jgi:hypothetical protein